jgi:hypothetical protein
MQQLPLFAEKMAGKTACHFVVHNGVTGKYTSG